VRISLLHFAAIGFLFGSTIGLLSQTPQKEAAGPPAAQHAASETITNPVADPRAVVALGRARFTVLTPELIRIEWAADGKFEDHASFVFINRRLPVPKFTREESDRKLTLKTSALTLNYDGSSAEGKFTAENLSIELTVDGSRSRGIRE